MKTKLLLSATLLFAVLISNGQWSYNELSAPRDRVSVAVVGTKAYFAGGEDIYDDPVSTIQVYDASLEDWDTSIHISLSVPRMHTAGVSCGNWILFAGGADMMTGITYSEVDIWNTVTNYNISKQLSVPRVFLSAVSNGEKALFAGGTNFFETYNIVDIYNTTTGDWSTTALSAPRCNMGAAVIGDMAFFAGGYHNETFTVSDVVDIYHFSTGTWTTETLSQARGFLSGASVGSKVLFAGGTNAYNEPSDLVDIYDTITKEWSTAQLSVARAFFDPSGALVCQNKVFFGCGGPMDLYTHLTYAYTDVVDIYDDNYENWSVDNLTQSMILYAVAGVEDHFILAGGWNSTGEYSGTLEIYQTNDPGCWTGLDPQPVVENSFRVFPNPSSGNIHLELQGDNSTALAANIYNMQGQLVSTMMLESDTRELHINLPDGVYLLRVITDKDSHTTLITIQN